MPCFDADGNPSIDAGFGGSSSTTVALPCGISITIPLPDLSLILPSLLLNLPAFPPKFPFSFELSCDPSDPIDITSQSPFGGGRLACFDPSPDDSDDF